MKKLRDRIRELMILCGLGSLASWTLLVLHIFSWVPFFVLTVLTLACGLVSLILGAKITIREAVPQDPSTPASASDDADVISRLLEDLDSIDDEIADTFVRSIVHPQSIFARISESGTLFENHTTRSITYSVSLPSYGSERIIALHVRARGVMMDGLKIIQGSSERISSLARDDNVRFLASALRNVAKRAGPRILSEYIQNFESQVLTLTLTPSTKPRMGARVIVGEVLRLQPQSRDLTQLLVLATLIQFLDVYNVVLVRIPAKVETKSLRSAVQSSWRNFLGDGGSEHPDVIRFSVEEKIIIRSERPSKRDGVVALVRGHIRPLMLALLGVRDNVIFYPLTSASRAKSYHFQSDGPDSAFLVSQKINRRPVGLDIRARPLEGQGYSHVYVTDGQDVGRAFYQGRYYDRPPGAIGTAAVAALSALFALVVLAIQHLRWTDVSANALNASLLLSLPGLVAAYLGFGRSSAFLAGSVSARLISVVSLLTSLSAVFVTAITPRTAAYSPDRLELDLAAMGPVTSFWLSLLLAQLATGIYAVGVWFYRTTLYYRLSKGKSVKAALRDVS